MTIVQMTPPAGMRQNSISFFGRTYYSPYGAPIPVPDFDVPVLQANGWDKLGASIIQPESWAARLRRLAAAGAADNPYSKPPLIGSVPWVTDTVYVAGATVSSGGFVYTTTSGGTSGATAPSVAAATLSTGSGLQFSDGTVLWKYVGAQTAPVVIASAIHNASLTKSITVSSFAVNNLLADTVGPVRVRGGVPTVAIANIVQVFSETILPSVGNLFGGGTQFGDSGILASFSTLFEGKIFEIQGGTTGTNGTFTILVNGQKIDSQPTFATGNYVFVTLDFTNISTYNGPVPAGTGRSRNLIEIQMSANWGIVQLAGLPTDTFSYPSVQDNFSFVVVGDSQTAGNGIITGTNSAPGQGANYGVQLQQWLELPDIVLSGVGATGYVANFSGARSNYIQRINDLARINDFRKIAYILIQSSYNDSAFSAGTIQAAAFMYFQALRNMFPTVPIFVMGVISGGSSTLALAQSTENAVFAAVASQANGDPLIFSIPMSTNPLGPPFTGTGNIGAPNGTGNSDFCISADSVHWSVQGHSLAALYFKQQLLKIVATN